ncbi:chemotaxis protein CheY [Candidatus Magnetobacterium bavaricum]|uniref:DNA-binding transcriptional regulator NtrC n=1 Tax=Candidatus Magnetobacterium bavaricum TaxID=29290 RepID=A0A0F3GN65_9BACT|nr:chemotaxis protein CheY [Candidatus Magnetobacterium bavaricum]
MQEVTRLDNKHRILIVDDEAVNRQMLRQILMDRYRLSFATDGMSALDVISKVRPDLVLLDIMMPGMDGYELCRRLKVAPVTSDIPIIFISALTDINKKVNAFNSGAVDYICNPFQREEVLVRVELHLNLYSLQKALQKSKDRYLWLYDSAPVGYFTLNRKTEILEVNLKGAAMLGGKKEDLTTKALSMFVKDDDREAFKKCMEGIFAPHPGNNMRPEIAMSALNGEDLWVTLYGTVVDSDLCLVVLIDITSKWILATEVRRLQWVLESSVENVLGKSHAARKIYKDIPQIAQSDLSIILLGETGCGKSFVAGFIHSLSNRSGRPFIKVDISALSEKLIESELFGHEKGAFTGADIKKKGFFEISSGGTIFLDEVHNIPLHLQGKILTIIDDNKVYPVGSTRAVDVDLRIICASNVDLYQLVVQNRFRRDLYYRLNEFSITIPPLRDRAEDIRFYAQKFLNDAQYELGKSLLYMTDDAIGYLMKHKWPGNIRELRNLIRRVVLFCKSEVISLENIMHFLDVDDNNACNTQRLSLKEIMERKELETMLAAIEEANGNKTKAASLLGITYRWLAQRLHYYGIVSENMK